MTADGLADDEIRSIYQTRDGMMWFVGLKAGVSRFDLTTNSWTTYTTEDGLAGNGRWGPGGIEQRRDGSLWVGLLTPGRGAGPGGEEMGISRFDGTRWETVSPPFEDTNSAHVSDIHEARDGSLWFATRSHGILRLVGTRWMRYGADKVTDWMFRAIGETIDGKLWFAGPLGVRRFDPAREGSAKDAWRSYTTNDGLRGNSGWSFWQDGDGALWLGGSARAIHRLEGDRWMAYTGSQLWGDKSHGGLVGRANHSLWIKDGSHVVHRFESGDQWTVYRGAVSSPNPSGLAGQNIFPIDGDIWFGDGVGVVRYDGESWIRFTSADGLNDGRVTTVLKGKDGSIWVAGQHRGKSGAAQFDGRRWKVFTAADGLVGNNIHNGYVASNGDVWFGTQGRGRAAGVIRFDGLEWRSYSTDDGLNSNTTYDIVETDGGVIWIATVDGISRFDPALEGREAWKSFRLGEVPQLQKVRTLCVARDGSLWAGFGSWSRGVVRYDGTTWKRYRAEDGLGDNVVGRIFETSDGVLWFATVSGLSRYDGQNWAIYSTDSMPISFAAFSTITQASDGSIWLSGEEGSSDIARFAPDRRGPETRIESTPNLISSAGDVFLKWSGADLWEETSWRDLRYRWRLDGADWSAWSNRTDVTLTSLTAGSHTFAVQAVDGSMNIDTTPARHAFIVEAPWWRNPLVAGPGLLLIIGILFQSARVVQAKRKLQDSVDALSTANNELFQVNVDLQREQVLERLRGQAQGMQSSEDIGPVVEVVYKELTELGLPLISSNITMQVSENETQVWVTDEDGQVAAPFTRETQGSPRDEAALQQGDAYTHTQRVAEEMRQSIRRMIERGHPRWKGVPEDRWPDKGESYRVLIERRSTIGILSEEVVEEDILMLIRRFGEVFVFAHSRWEELKLKEAQNRRLAVDAAVQRLRAEVQSMDETSDFERILSLLTESLKTVELTFDGCEIDVLDEPVENPTMAHFEANGFRYSTFRLDPDGNVASNSYNLAAPFPTVNEQTIERFIAGEPWQGLSDDLRIVEVPAGSYGRLRLTASDRDPFTDDEVATLREFADAVALGYARYLDIREIQEQTERKSAFLASMSHELRTPMNAIKGFTNLVLRRGKDELSERNQENLLKVDQASDHLLGMINDLLDLSKIEAGRMDVNATAFDVKELIASACDTVSPLIQEGVELRQDVADDIGEANTDQARLQQMVINLLSNAIKFTDSGSVTVRAERVIGGGKSGGQNQAGASRVSPDHGSRTTAPPPAISLFPSLTPGKAFPRRSSLPSSTSTVRLKGRRAAFRRERAWGCPLRRSSRNCWVGRSVWKARLVRAAHLPSRSRQRTNHNSGQFGS